MSTSRLLRVTRAVALAFALVPVPLLAATIDLLYGDIDGFGFADTSGLVDGSGNAADKNGNGILDDGDSLPNLGTNTTIGPAVDDYFDNQEPDDPALTDIGFTANSVLDIGFSFSLPANETVTSATFSLLGGDLSFLNQNAHTVSIDGQASGEILNAGSPFFDGRITLTEFLISTPLLNEFNDGVVVFSLYFDSAPDDIAIDYARLNIETAAVSSVSAVPLPPVVWLFCSGLIGLVGVARRRAE